MPLLDPYVTLLSPQQVAPTVFRVCRYAADGVGDPYTTLPLEFVHGRVAEGPRPSLFLVRYVFATNSGRADWPTSATAVLDLSTTGIGIVAAGDRLVVLAQGGDGTWLPVLDGFALDFSLALDGGSEAVEIRCEGVERTMFYTPVGGMFMRNADTPSLPERTYQTDLAAVFNPKGVANCCDIEGAQCENTAGHKYPCFIDPGVKHTDAGVDAVPWTLDGAVLYLANHHNQEEDLVRNPDDVTMLSGSDGTAVECPNKPISGKYWPDVVADLIGGKGFGMVWGLAGRGTGAAQTPMTRLVLFKQQAGELKDIYLQPEGTLLDLGLSNAAGIHLERSLHEVYNEVRVVGALERWEVSFILAPLFPMASADKDVTPAITGAPCLAMWDRADPNYSSANGHYYRWFGVDEAGEGHYEVGSATILRDAYDFSSIFGINPDDPPPVVRHRKPFGDLLSTGPGGGQLKAKLEYADGDYGGDYPGEWIAGFAADWKPVESDTWRLLKDRVGIELTCPNPNAWRVGHAPGKTTPIVVNLVEKLVAATRLLLRLTVVVESDRACTGLATLPHADDSILGKIVARTVDASDRLRYDVLSLFSRFNTSGEDQPIRDDRAKALIEATAAQTAHQDGVLEGPVRIPYFTLNYQVGDRIRSINGRGLSLRTDAGAEGQSPTYPAVVAIEWTSSSDEQWTILHLSDAGLVHRGIHKAHARALSGG